MLLDGQSEKSLYICVKYQKNAFNSGQAIDKDLKRGINSLRASRKGGSRIGLLIFWPHPSFSSLSAQQLPIISQPLYQLSKKLFV
jgi:hypothetical protein